LVNNISIRISIFLFTILLVCSCGSTSIITSDPNADIYMDNSYIGRGKATVRSIGFPNTAELEARRGYRVIGRSDMSRNFTFGTFCLGTISYFTGWIWGWYYPDEVFITCISDYSDSLNNSWNKPRQNKWMKPINSGKK
jgi:hypothetical protein